MRCEDIWKSASKQGTRCTLVVIYTSVTSFPQGLKRKYPNHLSASQALLCCANDLSIDVSQTSSLSIEPVAIHE